MPENFFDLEKSPAENRMEGDVQLNSDQLIEFLKNTLQMESDIEAWGRLFSTGALDSMSMMQLIDFVERAAGIEVRPDDVTLENFDSVEQIIRFASTKRMT